MDRDSNGLLICFWCKKPLKVLKNKDTEYAICHGQIISCGEKDLKKLKDYWNAKSQ